MFKKKYLITVLFLFVLTNIFSERLFYLSTDRTYAVGESKLIKIESGYIIDNLKIRVYRINNLEEFYLSQDDFNRPKVRGRDFRYFTPEIVDDFYGYLRKNLRTWAREKIPPDNRLNILESYPDFAIKSNEDGTTVNRMVNYINDPNFSYLNEYKYVLQNKNNDWNYNYIFLDELKEGTYLIEGISDFNVAYTVLNVSNFGFIVKKANEKILVYSLNNETGEPAANIELSIFNRFKSQVAKTKTGKNGIAEININDNEIFIIGKSENNFYSFYDPKYYPSNIRNDYVYLYTERPVYKGGDDVFIKGIYRNYKDDKYTVKNAGLVSIDIVNSNGNVISTLTANSTDDGIFYTKFKLPSDASSGRYVIVAQIGKKKYEGEFKVEYYKKPEFQVSVKTKEKIYTSGDKITASINAAYYFGSPVEEGQVLYSIYRTRFEDEQWGKNQDKDFYLSQNEFVYSQMELLETGDRYLDEKGFAEISFNSKKDSQSYNYLIQVVVKDKTEVPITGSYNVKVVPANFRVSIEANKFVYLINEDVLLSVNTGDYFNNPVAKEIKIIATTELANNQNYVYLDRKVNTDKTGSADIVFKANKNGFVKIHAEGKDEKGNLAVTEKFIWIGEEGASFNYKGGLVKLILDKPYYKIGDTAKLLILSPISGINFLLTVEGDKIYNYNIQKLSSNSMMVSIPVTGNYMPNVFIDVSFIFDNKFYNNSIKLDIPPSSQFLNIAVLPDQDVYKPKSSGGVLIKVTDVNNNPVANTDLSIAVVDEAIYAISQEIAIDIHKYFYPFRRNNIMTWASIGYRFYGYSMDAENELSKKFGKDPNGLASFKDEEQERKEFKDTILWIPSIKTDKDGTARFIVNFPDNITKWRITAVGINNNSLVGRAIGHVITKKDFFADLSIPNYLNELDSASVYGVIFNYTGEKLNATVELTGTNLLIDNNKKDISIDPNKNIMVEWKIMPKNIGEQELTLNLNSAKYKDIIKKKLNIVPHSILKSMSVNQEINSTNNILKFNMPKNIKNAGQKIYINLANGYLAMIIDSIPYLVMYPYGCVEQTTSSFLPNLVVVNAVKNLGIKLPGYDKNLPDIINKGLTKLYGYQNQDGSWGWWNDNQIDVFMTSYVLYALTLTKKLGFVVTSDSINRGLDSLEKNISKSKNNTETIYALYVLSMNNRKINSIFDGMIRSAANLSDYDLAMLVLTANNYNRKSDAVKFGSILEKRFKSGTDPQKVYWGDNDAISWNKDNVETTAWVIRAINAVNPSSQLIQKGLNWLFTQKDGNKWKSTRDTSGVVYAVCDVIKNTSVNPKGEYSIKLNNNEIAGVKFDKDNYKTDILLEYDKFSSLLKDENIIKIDGITDSKETVFASLNYQYYTNEAKISSGSSGLNITRNYYRLNESKVGENIKYLIGENIDSINKGENFIVELTLSAAKDLDYMMVEDYLPAGCVFVKDFLLYNIKGLENIAKPNFTDYRDNKVLFFINRTGSMKLYYVVSPVYTGKYKVLPATASLMYFPSVRGNCDDNVFTVK